MESSIVKSLLESKLLSWEVLGTGFAIWFALEAIKKTCPLLAANKWFVRFLPLYPIAISFLFVMFGWPQTGPKTQEKFIVAIWIAFWASTLFKILGQVILAKDSRLTETIERADEKSEEKNS